jgi:hypothetical protein
MVMPCSRSARRPSVSSARLVYSSPRAAGALDRLELVLEDRLRVVQQPPDERALAVVDRAGGGEAKEVHLEVALLLAVFHGGLAEKRSSARVAPRSVIRVAATSAMTSSSVSALDSTAPVQVMSPTVR